MDQGAAIIGSEAVPKLGQAVPRPHIELLLSQPLFFFNKINIFLQFL